MRLRHTRWGYRLHQWWKLYLLLLPKGRYGSRRQRYISQRNNYRYRPGRDPEYDRMIEETYRGF